MPSPTTGPAAAASVSAPAAAAIFPAAADLIGKQLEGGVIGRSYHLRDVRSGEHAGFTRIVWAMDEAAGAPRWTALLRPDVERTAVIDLVLSDVTAIDKPETLAALAVDSAVVDSVQPRELRDDAVLGFSVRLARPAGYRVTLLEGPVRVVVDVAHRR